MRGTDFAELTAFVAVAENRSFAKAAAQLGIAPSTLSQTIRTLEERLGVRLLNRTTRSVAPTEAGERLLAQLQPALDGVAQAVETVNEFRDKPMGTLRLLMGRVIAGAAIMPLIAPFLAAYPQIKLDIVSDDSRADLVEGRFDAGLRIGELIERDMVAVPLIRDLRIGCVASPEYLKGRDIPATPNALQGHACIRHRWAFDDTIHPWHFEKDGESIDIAVDGPLIVNDLNLAVGAAVTGAGIAYLPLGMIGRPIAERKLLPLLSDWCPTRSGVYIYYSSRRQVPAPLQAFIAFARKAVNASATPPYTAGSPVPE
jgi:DNA-binding transcriptional LysR family regulator